MYNMPTEIITIIMIDMNGEACNATLRKIIPITMQNISNSYS